MSALTADIVDRAIVHAQRLSQGEGYNWLIARAALTRVLADLEARDPGDPSLERLRAFLAERDQAMASRCGGP
jgi:hypothetical protein